MLPAQVAAWRMANCAVGLDYGTNSVRALIVDCADGREIGTCVIEYPSGEQGILLDPADHNLARQHPGDYLVGVEQAVAGALGEAASEPGFSADKVVGIGVDGTGSSPLPVNAENVPLAILPGQRANAATRMPLS